MIRKVSTLFRETEHPGKNLSDFIFQRNTNDQNNSYEVTINGFQVRKINEVRYGCSYGAKIKWCIIYMQSHALYVQSYDTYV